VTFIVIFSTIIVLILIFYDYLKTKDE